MQDKIGIVANRLTVGFTFAFIYQFIVGIATSLLSLPLTGNLQDLISGIEQIESHKGYWFITWWIISTVIITSIALVLVRYKKYISPFKHEKDLDIPPKITAVTAVIIGSIISFLFFLLDLIIGAIAETGSATDVQAIYQAAITGDFAPLSISIVFSIIAGFIIVGVAGKTAKIKEITKDVGFSNVAGLGKIISKKSKDVTTTADTIGLIPGELVHVGERKVDKVTFDIFEYSEDGFSETLSENSEDCLIAKEKSSKFWINITGIHNPQIVQKFGQYFGLHKLTQADIMNAELRPKIEIKEDYIFMILKMPYFDKESEQLTVEQISLVLGKNYVLSFQELPDDVFGAVRESIRTGEGDARVQKSDYLAYLLVDALIDSFFAVLEKIGDTTERLEKVLMEEPNPRTLQTIHALKRQMSVLRKAIWPLREVTDSFERTSSNLVSPGTKTYLRDVYNHTVQVMDTIESIRDIVGGMLDTYLSSLSNKMNEVMKTLTVIASIFIPITFIAGIYGTNFEYIPELSWHGSYFIMIAAMITIVVIMIAWFKKRKWL